MNWLERLVYRFFNIAQPPIKRCELYKTEGCTQIPNVQCDIDHCQNRLNYLDHLKEKPVSKET